MLRIHCRTTYLPHCLAAGCELEREGRLIRLLEGNVITIHPCLGVNKFGAQEAKREDGRGKGILVLWRDIHRRHTKHYSEKQQNKQIMRGICKSKVLRGVLCPRSYLHKFTPPGTSVQLMGLIFFSHYAHICTRSQPDRNINTRARKAPLGTGRSHGSRKWKQNMHLNVE